MGVERKKSNIYQSQASKQATYQYITISTVVSVSINVIQIRRTERASAAVGVSTNDRWRNGPNSITRHLDLFLTSIIDTRSEEEQQRVPMGETPKPLSQSLYIPSIIIIIIQVDMLEGLAGGLHVC